MRFAVAGLNTEIEVYDQETYQNINIFNREDHGCHDQKIMTVRFFPEIGNKLYSGAWDGKVKFWDLRVPRFTSQLNGTQSCGDSVDMDTSRNIIVTGGGLSNEGIQLWDIRNLSKPTKRIPWRIDNSLGD